MTPSEKQEKIRDNHSRAYKDCSRKTPDEVRDEWSEGRLLREILEKVRPLGVLDDYELLELAYIAARIDSIDEERYGVDGMGEI